MQSINFIGASLILSIFSDDGVIHFNSHHKMRDIMKKFQRPLRLSDYTFSALLIFDKKQNRDLHILNIPRSINLF